MNSSQMKAAIHSPDDEATIKQWRRLVCVFYGVIGLALVAAAGVQQFVSHRYGDKGRVASSTTPTSASRVLPHQDKRP
jgi:hypothetical protein